MAPGNRNQRVLRRLRLQWADTADQDQALSLEGMPARTGSAERKEQLQQLGRARGLTQEQISQIGARLSYKTIVQTAGTEARELTGRDALFFWMVSSGIAHARTWAVLSMLDRVESPGDTEDLVHLELTASEKAIPAIANVAALMLNEGWRLYDERCHVHLGP